MEIFCIINDLKEENFKYGGIYYHHKTIEENNFERSYLEEKKKKDKQSRQYKFKDEFLSENFINTIKDKASKNFNLSKITENINTNPFDDIINKIEKNENLIDKDEILYKDMIIMLPFDSILSYKRYSKTINYLSMIVFKPETNFFIGFITFKKLINEITEFNKNCK